MLATRHGHLEGDLQDALNLRTRIDIGVESHIVVLMLFTKIHATRQFADDHEIGTTQQFLLQRRFVQQAIKRGHRTDVGKESEFLAHRQQACLRTHLQRGIIVVFQVANSSEQDCISAHADIMSRIWIGIATGINGTGTYQRFLILEFMTTFLGNGVHYCHTLFHNLWANAVTSQYRNFQFHIIYFSLFRNSVISLYCYLVFYDV